MNILHNSLQHTPPLCWHKQYITVIYNIIIKYCNISDPVSYGDIPFLCAIPPTQSQTLTVNRQMNRYRVPRIAFINKLDRIGANPERVVSQIR